MKQIHLKLLEKSLSLSINFHMEAIKLTEKYFILYNKWLIFSQYSFYFSIWILYLIFYFILKIFWMVVVVVWWALAKNGNKFKTNIFIWIFIFLGFFIWKIILMCWNIKQVNLLSTNHWSNAKCLEAEELESNGDIATNHHQTLRVIGKWP